MAASTATSDGESEKQGKKTRRVSFGDARKFTYENPER